MAWGAAWHPAWQMARVGVRAAPLTAGVTLDVLASSSSFVKVEEQLLLCRKAAED